MIQIPSINYFDKYEFAPFCTKMLQTLVPYWRAFASNFGEIFCLGASIGDALSAKISPNFKIKKKKEKRKFEAKEMSNCRV